MDRARITGKTFRVHLVRDPETGAVTSFGTDRLRGQQMSAGHAEYLEALHAKADVMRFVGGIRDATESAAWLDRNLAHWEEHHFGQWMLRDLDDQLIGRGGLRTIDPCVGEDLIEVGYILQRNAWGAGLATEATAAFVEIASTIHGLTELGGLTLEGNLASTRVLEKNGFAFERWVDHAVGRHQFLRRVEPAR